MKKKWSILKCFSVLLCLSFLLGPDVYAEVLDQKLESKDIRENIYDGVMLSKDVYLMVGERGRIYRLTDSGEGWENISSGSRDPLFSISFPDDRNGWISGNSGLILHTKDGGKTWEKQNSGTKRDLLAIDFFDSSRGMAVGDWGAVVKTEDGGSSWQDVSPTEDVVIYGVKYGNPHRILLSGEFGMIFSTKDSGATWQSQTPVMGKTLFCISEDKDTMLAGGMGSSISGLMPKVESVPASRSLTTVTENIGKPCITGVKHGPHRIKNSGVLADASFKQ